MKCYINYLNKDNKFKETRKDFENYEQAKKWANDNLEKFHPDMINYY